MPDSATTACGPALHTTHTVLHALNQLHTTNGLVGLLTAAIISFAALPYAPRLVIEAFNMVKVLLLYRMLSRRSDLSGAEYTAVAKMILRKK